MFLLLTHIMHAFSEVQVLRQLVTSSESVSEAFQYATKILDPSISHLKAQILQLISLAQSFQNLAYSPFFLWAPLSSSSTCLSPQATLLSTSCSSLLMLRPRLQTGAPRRSSCFRSNGVRWPVGPRYCMRCLWRQEWW